MVSMCCEDCKTEKLKSNVLNKIVLHEHCKNICEYLGCDDCCKILHVTSHPIYTTLSNKQQKLFKFVQLFPFPENSKALKEELKYRCPYQVHLCYINSLTKKMYPIVKDIYENLFIDWSKEKSKMRSLLETTSHELNKRRKVNKVDKGEALMFLIYLIKDLIQVYEMKSGWHLRCRGKTTYTYPSYRKFIAFCAGGRMLFIHDLVYESLVRGVRQ